MSLQDYGWSSYFSEAFDALGNDRLAPGRVVMSGAGSSRIVTERGERQASIAGSLLHAAGSAAERPAVGDWVAFRDADDESARIEKVLPRRTRLSRKVTGKRSVEQLVAANVDLVVVVMGLDGDFSLRRLERMLTMVRESGARPAALLNKVDLCEAPEARRAEVERIAAGVPVLLSNCLDGDGVDAVTRFIPPRETAVLVGSSGVGKSTLINRLLGRDAQETQGVREGDDRGRHTTTHRELFQLPAGGLLIDNPGIREVQLWSSSESLEQTFDDVLGLGTRCRYGDCGHESEPGCAVIEAVESGTLPRSRLESYHALRKELGYLNLRRSQSAQRVQKTQWRAIHKEMRRAGKFRKK